MGFPVCHTGKETACQCRRHKRPRFNPWVGKIPWRRTWHHIWLFFLFLPNLPTLLNIIFILYMDSFIILTYMFSCCSVTMSCLILCDLMDCSMLGFPVLHQFPEFAQIHVHWVDAAIEPTHPLPTSSPFASIFSSIRVFSRSFWFLKSGGAGQDSQESSIPQFKSINSSVLSFFYSPTLTSIHDHWKTHRLD